MSNYEYVGNPHVHTCYSDGQFTHEEVAQAASRAGLDFVIVSDHNVWVDGCEGYYDKVLLLVGEEIHDVRLRPQANHLLVYNARAEVAPLAPATQKLIDTVNQREGLCFIAHPYEYASPTGPDLEAIPWVDWDVTGYIGLEIWNYMSEFKAHARNKPTALLYAYFPSLCIRGPFQATLEQWDKLLIQRKRVSAIGGADAHGNTYSLGPLKRVIFPYEYLFRCVNTHILTTRPMSGRANIDRVLVYDALRAGHTWVGYDLLAPTAGFRFHARSGAYTALMGDQLERTGALTFEVQVPDDGEINLLRNGQTVAQVGGRYLKHTTAEAGAYRVEVYRRHRLQRRGWIFSSPIYTR